MEIKAKFWKEENGNIRCLLCPHYCIIRPNQRGICGVRENKDGTLYSLIYASCSSAHQDPIEKKPLYHFHPGSLTYSLGSVGCNLKCLHCQNYTISQVRPEKYALNEMSPKNAVTNANKNCDGIAWTYNEPTIWMEYIHDTSKIAKKHSLYTVFVTNGYINKDPLDDIVRYLDAANIDIKSMNNSFYRDICIAKLEPILESCKYYKDS